jgi:hypothetical protein
MFDSAGPEGLTQVCCFSLINKKNDFHCESLRKGHLSTRMANFDEDVDVIADKYCGDIVEIEEQRVLKIRFFRSPDTKGKFNEMPTVATHVDHYYDTDDFSLGQKGQYLRVRQVDDSQRIISHTKLRMITAMRVSSIRQICQSFPRT